MNNKVDRFQFLVNGKNKNLINKVKIHILIESLKVRRICDSQPSRGECLAPAVKIPYRRPCPPNRFGKVTPMLCTYLPNYIVSEKSHIGSSSSEVPVVHDPHPRLIYIEVQNPLRPSRNRRILSSALCRGAAHGSLETFGGPQRHVQRHSSSES